MFILSCRGNVSCFKLPGKGPKGLGSLGEKSLNSEGKCSVGLDFFPTFFFFYLFGLRSICELNTEFVPFFGFFKFIC